MRAFQHGAAPGTRHAVRRRREKREEWRRQRRRSRGRRRSAEKTLPAGGGGSENESTTDSEGGSFYYCRSCVEAFSEGLYSIGSSSGADITAAAVDGDSDVVDLSWSDSDDDDGQLDTVTCGGPVIDPVSLETTTTTKRIPS